MIFNVLSGADVNPLVYVNNLPTLMSIDGLKVNAYTANSALRISHSTCIPTINRESRQIHCIWFHRSSLNTHDQALER